MSRRIAFWLLIAVSVVVVYTGYRFWDSRRATAELLHRGNAAFDLNEYSRAETLATRVLQRDPGSPEALKLAAEAALKAERYDAAADYFLRMPGGEGQALGAHWAAARRRLKEGRLSDAERHLRRVLERNPLHVEANRELARLLSLEGRRVEAAAFQMKLVEMARFSVEELLLLSNPEEPFHDPAALDRAIAAVPDDPVPLMGVALPALLKNRPAEAAEALRKVTANAPRRWDAQALLGQALLELRSRDEWAAWQRTLPREADRDAGIWFVRGSSAEAQGWQPEAARCQWEAVRLDPNHRRAVYQLGRLLTAQGRHDDAAPFLDRARRLSEVHDLLHPIFTEGPRVPSMLRAGELMESLGRPWEAWAWYFAAAAYDPQNVRATAERDRLLAVLKADRPPRTLPNANPASRLDLSDYPLPRWSAPGSAAPAGTVAAARTRAKFEDVAVAAGIDFRYFNSGDPARQGKRMFETTGGGVAVLDLDADGRPDLHFTQGCRWPPQSGQTEHLDRCFRNVGGQFADVTRQAGLGDDRFGQGCAAGDLDNDGFADLYLGNIGGNRLYRNNGDGTFVDIAVESGVAGESWTTSCVIADLNADGLPDLYDVNYLRGREVFERLCGAHLKQSCAPSIYDGAPDQAYQNFGDGHWADVTSAAGVGALLGKGLGIVAADLAGTGRLSLFVANDGEANFLLTNQTESPGGTPRLSEDALLAGVAFDRNGRAQAYMGVAADDADGNGLLDFYVTTFYEDSKTLFLQQPGTLFVDGTVEAGLRDPGYYTLGFGTQFLDIELDGLPDIVQANGHIDDYSFEGKPYRMRPQLFRNGGNARFTELPPDSLGAWFQGEYLGRGLARLDWNNDGLEDFAVSDLEGPAALVTNRTEGAGRFTAVRLAGVASARDAIGATVTAKAGGKTHVRQLTAGDGYQASNERKLVFGLGASERVEQLTVRWPSGATQNFSRLSAGDEYLLIEGRGRPVPLFASNSRP